MKPNIVLVGAGRAALQCDDCIVHTEMHGVPVDVALTFCADEHGRPFRGSDPNSRMVF